MYACIHQFIVHMSQWDRTHTHTHTPLHAIKQPAWRRSCAPIQACNKIASTCLFYVEYIHETVALPVPWHFLAWQMMQCTSSYPLPSRIYNLWYSPHERTENKRNAYTKVMYVFFTCCLTSNHSPLTGKEAWRNVPWLVQTMKSCSNMFWHVLTVSKYDFIDSTCMSYNFVTSLCTLPDFIRDTDLLPPQTLPGSKFHSREIWTRRQ